MDGGDQGDNWDVLARIAEGVCPYNQQGWA